MADKGEDRAGVTLTNLDQELFEGAGATKRDLVDYLDAVADRMLPVLRERPLSVIRLLRGQDKVMRRNRSTERAPRSSYAALPGCSQHSDAHVAPAVGPAR